MKPARVGSGRVPDRVVGIRPAFMQREVSPAGVLALQVIGILGVLQVLIWVGHAVWCGESWLVDQVKAWF